MTGFVFKREFLAVATLLGTIVGVGIFTLPYVAAQAGFWLTLGYLVFFTGVLTLIHLYYGEITLRTRTKHRLTGYARLYLGKTAEKIQGGAIIFGIYGALLAYGLAGGEFLRVLLRAPLPGVTSFTYSLVFFGVGLFIVWRGIKTIAKVEFFSSFFLVIVVLVIWGQSLPVMEPSFFTSVHLSNLFLPYGVVVFSLMGLVAIPELKELLLEGRVFRRARHFKKAVFWGTILSAVLMVFFMWAVVGVTGLETTPEALKGLAGRLGEQVIIWGALFGVAAVFTSFLVLADNLKRTYTYDFGINRNLAWVLVALVPVALFLLGFVDLIKVVGLVGAVSGGIAGIMVALIHRKAVSQGKRRPEYSIAENVLVRWGLIAIFSLGIIYELFSVSF